MNRLRHLFRWLRWFFTGPGFSYSQHLDDNTRQILLKRWLAKEPKP